MPAVLRLLCLTIFVIFLPWAQAAAEPGTIFKDCDVCPKMIVLPIGSVRIGATEGDPDAYIDEGPAYIRKVSTPLAVGMFEVTNAEYAAFVFAANHQTPRKCRTEEHGTRTYRVGRWWGSPGYPTEARQPVVCLTWSDVVAYLTWLREKTNQPYRLPTEIEWEFAARSGTDTRFWYGDDPDYSLLCKYGNVGPPGFRPGKNDPPTVCFDGYEYPAPVGSFPPNLFGLYDMIGNVSEWTTDCYVKNDPYNPATVIESDEKALCTRRSHRGGAWNYPAQLLRTSERGTHRFWTQSASVGFRVVRPYEIFVSAAD